MYVQATDENFASVSDSHLKTWRMQHLSKFDHSSIKPVAQGHYQNILAHVQRLREIIDDVLRIFETNREADNLWSCTCRSLLIFRELAVHH